MKMSIKKCLGCPSSLWIFCKVSEVSRLCFNGRSRSNAPTKVTVGMFELWWHKSRLRMMLSFLCVRMVGLMGETSMFSAKMVFFMRGMPKGKALEGDKPNKCKKSPQTTHRGRELSHKTAANATQSQTVLLEDSLNYKQKVNNIVGLSKPFSGGHHRLPHPIPIDHLTLYTWKPYPQRGGQI